LRWKEYRLTVDVNHADVTYTVRDGPGAGMTIRHAGEEVELSTQSPSTIAIRQRHPMFPPPPQPPGREPMRRRVI
jgi:trehalose/maltose hydrolase-like predicted phosphorylase